MRSRGDFAVGSPLVRFYGAIANDRGTVAGNGGKMAGKHAAELKVREKQTRVKPGVAADVVTHVRAIVATKVETAREKSADANDEELQIALGKCLGHNSGKFTRKLLRRTVGSDLLSAKLVFLLAEPQKGRKDTGKNKRGRSVAKMWAAEPQWHGEQTEETAEAGAGSMETGV